MSRPTQETLKPEFCCPLSFTHVTIVKLYSSYGKIGGFRRKHFVQNQEIFIANQVSVIVKDKEKTKLFERSHATTKNL